MTVFETATGRRLATITGHPRPVATVTFSPDGRCLATADYNNLLGENVPFRYWELATRSERHRFDGHVGRVHALAFSPSGTLLAAASPDAPVYLWDVYGRQTAPPPKPWSAQEGEQLWQALASPQAGVAFAALCRLIRTPGPAIALLRARVKRAEPVEPNHVQRWLVELDAEDFAMRQAAFTALEQLGDRH